MANGGIVIPIRLLANRAIRPWSEASMHEPHETSAAELSAQYRTKDLSPVEVSDGPVWTDRGARSWRSTAFCLIDRDRC